MLHLSLLASTGYLQGPVAPLSQTARADVQMFVGGEQANPRENFKTKATPSLIKTGKAPAKSKSKRAISTKSTTSTFIDVTGRKYQEVDTFVPQFDEVGVLPPLGRWDPLQIREQVRALLHHPASPQPRGAGGAIKRGGGASRGGRRRESGRGGAAPCRTHRWH